MDKKQADNLDTDFGGQTREPQDDSSLIDPSKGASDTKESRSFGHHCLERSEERHRYTSH